MVDMKRPASGLVVPKRARGKGWMKLVVIVNYVVLI